jgi:hypothetical protein
MRHDPQLKAVLSAYKLPILRATWAVDPAGCRDEVVTRVSDNLGLPVLGVDSPPGAARRRGVIWQRHLKDALKFLEFGHAVFELRYRIEADGFASLDNLGPRMPWTIAEIKIDDHGLVEFIRQTTQLDPIPAGRLIWYVGDQEGSNWAGIPMMRAAFGAWLLKHETWRVNATSIRRFGMGVPTVEAPQGATQTMVAQAQQLASSMRTGDSAGMGIPAGFKASLMGVTGSVPDALGFIRYLDQSMAKMALAGLIELGQTQTGSRALGDTFMDLFLLSLQAVADDIATTATSGQTGMPGIVTDLVDQNWGEDEPAPRVVCTDVGENYEITAQSLEQLTITGALSPDENLDTWVRKTWHLPERKGQWMPTSRGVPAVAQQKKSPTPGQAAEIAQADDTAQAPPARQPAQTQQAQTTAASAPTRAQAAYLEASRFDAAAHQQDWELALAHLLLQYRGVLSAQRTDLVDRVITAMQAGRPQDFALVPPAAGDGPSIVAQAMDRVAQQAAAALVAEAADQGVTIGLDRVRIDAAQLGGVAQARSGVASSYLAQQAGSKALQVYDPTPAGFAAAADEVDRYLASLSDATLRDQLGAALTAAQNHGRIAVLEAAPESAGTARYVAAEFLDKNTCENCRKIDGTEFGDLAEAEAAYPTGGYSACLGLMRCRGTVVPVWGGNDTMPRHASAGNAQ